MRVLCSSSGQTATINADLGDTVGTLCARVAERLHDVDAAEVLLFRRTADGAVLGLGTAGARVQDTELALHTETLLAATCPLTWHTPAAYSVDIPLAVSQCRRWCLTRSTVIDLTMGTHAASPTAQCTDLYAVGISHRFVAAAVSTMTVQLLDRAEGTLLHTLCCDGTVNSLAFSTCADIVVVASTAGVYIFSTTSGECVRHIGGWCFEVQVSRCARWAIFRTSTLTLQDLTNGVQVWESPVGDNGCSACFSPCSSWVGASCGRHVVVFRRSSGVAEHTLKHVAAVRAVAFSVECVFSSAAGQVVQWDMATAAPLHVFTSSVEVLTLAVSNDSMTLLFGHDSGVTIHRVPAPEARQIASGGEAVDVEADGAEGGGVPKGGSESQSVKCCACC